MARTEHVMSLIYGVPTIIGGAVVSLVTLGIGLIEIRNMFI